MRVNARLGTEVFTARYNVQRELTVLSAPGCASVTTAHRVILLRERASVLQATRANIVQRSATRVCLVLGAAKRAAVRRAIATATLLTDVAHAGRDTSGSSAKIGAWRACTACGVSRRVSARMQPRAIMSTECACAHLDTLGSNVGLFVLQIHTGETASNDVDVKTAIATM